MKFKQKTNNLFLRTFFSFFKLITMTECKQRREKPVVKGCCCRGHDPTKTKCIAVETQSLYSNQICHAICIHNCDNRTWKPISFSSALSWAQKWSVYACKDRQQIHYLKRTKLNTLTQVCTHAYAQWLSERYSCCSLPQFWLFCNAILWHIELFTDLRLCLHYEMLKFYIECVVRYNFTLWMFY